MKVSVIGTKIPTNNGLVTKTQNDSVKQVLEKKIEDVGKKIPNTSGLVKKTVCCNNTKITKIENKIPSVTSFVTTYALNTKSTETENKMPDITNLATKVIFEYKRDRK